MKAKLIEKIYFLVVAIGSVLMGLNPSIGDDDRELFRVTAGAAIIATALVRPDGSSS